MNILLSQKELLSIVKALMPIAKKAPLPILRDNILVEVSGEFAYFTATDLAKRVTRRVKTYSPNDRCALLFPTQSLGIAAQALKGNVSITETGLSDARQSFTLQTTADDDYPLPPRMGGISVMVKDLGRIINRILPFSASNKRDHERFNHIQMVFDGDKLTVAGGNISAMLRETIPCEGDLHHTSWVPTDFAKLLPDGMVTIEIANNTILVSDFNGNQWFYTSGIDENRPDWSRIKSDYEFVVEFAGAPQHPYQGEFSNPETLVHITLALLNFGVDGNLVVTYRNAKSEIPLTHYDQPFPMLSFKPQDWTAAMKVGSPVRMSWGHCASGAVVVRLDIDGSTVYLVASVTV